MCEMEATLSRGARPRTLRRRSRLVFLLMLVLGTGRMAIGVFQFLPALASRFTSRPGAGQMPRERQKGSVQ